MLTTKRFRVLRSVPVRIHSNFLQVSGSRALPGSLILAASVSRCPMPSAARRCKLVLRKKNCSILILSVQYDWYKTDHLSCLPLYHTVSMSPERVISPFFVITATASFRVPVDKSRCHNNRIVNIELGGDQHGNLLIKRVKHTI
jgi:hypothetical protein